VVLGGEEMILHWPQMTFLLLTFMGFGLVVAKHGQPRDNYNIITSVIDLVATLVLLYYGGFFGCH
jgi:hypothetical protein